MGGLVRVPISSTVTSLAPALDRKGFGVLGGSRPLAVRFPLATPTWARILGRDAFASRVGEPHGLDLPRVAMSAGRTGWTSRGWQSGECLSMRVPGRLWIRYFSGRCGERVTVVPHISMHPCCLGAHAAD